MIHLDIREEFSMNWIALSFMGNPYFDLFNTREIVKIKGLDDEGGEQIIEKENKITDKLKKIITDLKKKVSRYKQHNEDIKILDELM